MIARLLIIHRLLNEHLQVCLPLRARRHRRGIPSIPGFLDHLSDQLMNLCTGNPLSEIRELPEKGTQLCRKCRILLFFTAVRIFPHDLIHASLRI